MRETLSLAGRWQACLDGSRPEEVPPPESAFAETIDLPATTETAGLGPLNPDHRADRLTAVRRIEGAVWYQRDFEVPATWSDRSVTLLLERTKACRVWLDGRLVGENVLLCVPHEHRLGVLRPGRHRLTLRVDNRPRPAPGDNHQTSEHTQGNWNGVLGAIELRATGALRIGHVTVAPDLAARAFHLMVRLARAGEGECSYYEHPHPPLCGEPGGNVRNTNIGVPPGAAYAGTVVVVAGGARAVAPAAAVVRLTLPLGSTAALWDEFSPVLHRVTVTLDSPDGRDERVVTVGLREFRHEGTQFTLNGRTTCLRGEVNCCVFPLTGHPPMELNGWRHYFQVLRDHGLNHVRFHSWTPPDAAFTAADELGFYVLTELPFWGEWTPAIADALALEGEAILRAYGHHPSLVMLSLGNEHRGDRAARAGLVDRLRAIDPTRLHAQGANNDLEKPALAAADDYWITARLPAAGEPGHYVNVRGGHATPDRADGHLQIGPGGTSTDYRTAIAPVAVPVVSHEIGQYSCYPRYAEIARYTGVFAAHNLERFRERARAAGLLERADRFASASAALAALCYREEIEAALRTPGFGGFELLGLQDFPGQGTALVGLLDAFLESKGAMTPATFRQFCGPEVLLARFERHTWIAGEAFRADMELAHYGPTDFPAGEIRWSLGSTQGILVVPAVHGGGLRHLGELAISLPLVPEAVCLTLTLEHRPSRTVTSNPLWLYPVGQAETPAGVTLAHAGATDTREILAAGGSVLLCADVNRRFTGTPGGGFTPDFWCWSMFKNVPGTLGLVISAEHPSLAGFPTETHTNWQWLHLARAAQPVRLEGFTPGLVPVIEVIDNPERAQPLGLLFEARVGPGRLLVCAIDLPALAHHHPEARALLRSLLAYAASPAFQPAVVLSPDSLTTLLATEN